MPFLFGLLLTEDLKALFPRFQLEASDSQSPDLTRFQTGPQPQPLTLSQAIHKLRLISSRKTERQQCRKTPNPAKGAGIPPLLEYWVPGRVLSKFYLWLKFKIKQEYGTRSLAASDFRVKPGALRTHGTCRPQRKQFSPGYHDCAHQ